MGLSVQETVSFLISNGNSLNFEDEIILEEENCNILKNLMQDQEVFWEIINGEIRNFGIFRNFW